MSDLYREENIAFDVMPPDLERVWVPILSPRPGTAIRGEIISTHLIGAWTHYLDGRTVPHLKDATLCEGCIAKRSKRWKGYYEINWIAKGRIALAELTPWAVAHCAPLDRCPYRTVRGWLIELTRPAGSPRGRVSCMMQPPPYRREPSALPEPSDVPALLCRIWAGRKDGPTGVLQAGEDLETPPF